MHLQFGEQFQLSIYQHNKIGLLRMHPARFSVNFFSIFIILTFLQIVPAASDRLLVEQKNQTQLPSPSNNHVQVANVSVFNITFAEYKQLYGKKYSTVAEENYRAHVFARNLRKMNKHNQNASRTYNMKPNNFLDVTTSEFKELFTGTYQSDDHSKNISNSCLHKGRKRSNQSLNASKSNQTHVISPDSEVNSTAEDALNEQNITEGNDPQKQHDNLNQATPSRLLTSYYNSSDPINSSSIIYTPPTNVNIDWSIYSGTIRYQGYCGACYAFTAVDTLSAMKAINQYSFFLPLSVQEIIDCSTNGLTFGCSGGYLEGAFTYIQLNGINTEYIYPYTSANSGKAGKCQQTGGPFKLTSFNSITEGDCSAIINSLALGPVSAGIAGYNLQFYDSGVFNDCNKVLDHAIVIVGYRSGTGWRIKNSWGVQWGDSGYGWIAQGNTCGICNMAVTVVA